MGVLGVALIAIGCTDLIRGRTHQYLLAASSAGIVIIAALAVVADLSGWWNLARLLIAGITLIAWTWTSTHSHRVGRHERIALASFIIGVAALLVTSGAGTPAAGALGRWMRWLDLDHLHAMQPAHFLLLAGVLLTQIATGNELVRLVLGSVGAIKPSGEPQASDRLRGGRLLGPMERIFILGLGLAGQVTAAGLVIAAKGLIRFPELNARRSNKQEVNGVGIDEVTEYFLVGSFVSWLIALVGLAAVALN